MNLYDIRELESEIDEIAAQNEGEIPDDKMQALVLARTQGLDQVESLVQYIRHLEMGIENCDDELNRIQDVKKRASNRIASIKAYLTPFVASSSKGKITVNTFTLSIRKSESVEVDELQLDKKYIRESIKYTPDKSLIKLDLTNGIEVKGAILVQKNNLQIK